MRKTQVEHHTYTLSVEEVFEIIEQHFFEQGYDTSEYRFLSERTFEVNDGHDQMMKFNPATDIKAEMVFRFVLTKEDV